MPIPGDHQGIDIVPGSMEPCGCGATIGSLRIHVPKNFKGTIEGVHAGFFGCACGKEIPCMVKIDLQKHRLN